MYGAETWTLKKAQENKLEVAEMQIYRYEGVQDKKWKNKRDNESGGNCQESTGKEVEVVWACDVKRGALRRKEGDRNETTKEKEERKA